MASAEKFATNDLHLFVFQETIESWCKRGHIHGYPECRTLTFNIAAQVLLGFRFHPQEVLELMTSFEMLNDNIFSLPINVPGFGLNKVSFFLECIVLLFKTAKSPSFWKANEKFQCKMVLNISPYIVY